MVEYQAGNPPNQYRSNTINALKQNLVVKRLAPFFTTLATVLPDIQKDQMAAFNALAKVLSQMPDEDVVFIQNECLLVTSRLQQEANVWAKVFVPNGGLAFQDIDLLALNTIIFNVLRDSLGNFINGIVQVGSPTAAPMVSS